MKNNYGLKKGIGDIIYISIKNMEIMLHSGSSNIKASINQKLFPSVLSIEAIPVRFSVLMTPKGNELISIEDAAKTECEPSLSDSLKYIDSHWSQVMKSLA